jgi:cytochrome c556
MRSRRSELASGMKTILPALIGVSILGLAGCHGSENSSSKAPPALQASFQDIMLTQIDASADKIWGSTGSIIDATGDHSLAPKTEEDWRELRAAVVTLIEGADQLTTEGRPLVQPHGKIQDEGAEGVASPDKIRRSLIDDRAVFLQRVRALQSVGVETLGAVDRRDLAAIERQGETLDAACEACHERFWYPPKPRR